MGAYGGFDLVMEWCCRGRKEGRMNCGWEIPVLAGSIKATRSGSKIMRLKVEKGYFGRKKTKKQKTGNAEGVIRAGWRSLLPPTTIPLLAQ